MWSDPSNICAVCLEPLGVGEDTLRGSPECSHFFHAVCVQQWRSEKRTCPLCRGSAPSSEPERQAAPEALEAPSRAVRLWTWLTLLLTPWPRASAPVPAANGEEWDASRGIGDWRARLERIYAAEAAAEAAGSGDDDDSDDASEEDEPDEQVEDEDEDGDEDEDEGEGAGRPTNEPALRFVLTTNAGLEEVVRDEVLEASRKAGLLPPIPPTDIELRPWGCPGRVLVRRPAAMPRTSTAAAAGGAVVSGTGSDGVGGGGVGVGGGGSSGSGCVLPGQAPLEAVLLGLRTVHDTLWHHGEWPLPEGADPPLALYEQVRVAPLARGGGPCVSLFGGGRSFRVSCVREGEHCFSSLDIEREVGGALHELYGAPAAMKGFALRIRVDVARALVLIGTALNAEPLSRRHKLAFTRSVTLKPNVARAMLHLGGCTADTRLLDPCCGSGTIPLEAAEALGTKAHGLDKSERVVAGALANAAAAGASIEQLVSFSAGNARSLDRLFDKGSFDLIVTNVPWGVQTAKSGGDSKGGGGGKGVGGGKGGWGKGGGGRGGGGGGGAGGGDDSLIQKIYAGLLRSSHVVLTPGAKMVVLVLRWQLLVDLVRRSGEWTVVDVVPIRTSNLTPVIVLLERLDEDALKARLAERLAPLQNYFVGDGRHDHAPLAEGEEGEEEALVDEEAEADGEEQGGG